MSLQDNFRKAMRSYVYSVSILSNVTENKEYNAITVSSVTSVSIDPPSILVCINKTAGIHDSIKLGTKYCINLLTKTHEELSNICSNYEEEKNRFISDQWDLSDIPFLKDAQANIYLEYSKYNEIEIPKGFIVLKEKDVGDVKALLLIKDEN